ncbi:MAG: hypothetical protein RLZZ22_1381 [Pseudomonadota bacterium]|jgi:hypothetical protein
MVLRLMPVQYEAMGRASYLQRLRELIRHHFPQQAAGIDDDRMDERLWAQTLLARRYGLEDEHSAARFALTAFLLGEGFDRSVPALAQILDSDQLSPSRKAQALEDFTLLLFSLLEGHRADPAQERAP